MIESPQCTAHYYSSPAARCVLVGVSAAVRGASCVRTKRKPAGRARNGQHRNSYTHRDVRTMRCHQWMPCGMIVPDYRILKKINTPRAHTDSDTAVHSRGAAARRPARSRPRSSLALGRALFSHTLGCRGRAHRGRLTHELTLDWRCKRGRARPSTHSVT